MIKLLNKKEVIGILTKQRNREDKGYIDYLASSYIYVMVNYKIIELYSKPSISNNLAYDDETEPVEINIDYFIEYNLSLNFMLRWVDKWLKAKKELEENGCCTGAFSRKLFINENNVICGFYTNRDYGSDKYRYLDDDETEQFLKIVEDQKELYVKRLQTYFKRYRSKIHNVGYWANR